MISSALTITGIELVTTGATEAARQQRDELLAIARKGKTIVNADSATRAADLLKQIKSFTRMLEVARKEAKAPVLVLAQQIDGLADELTSALEIESARVGGILATWQTEQNRIAEEARHEAWRKEQAIKREAEEKERAAAAEARRIEQEAADIARKEQEAIAAKAAKARSEAQREKLAAQAEESRKQAEAAAEQRAKDEATAQRARDDATAATLVANRVAVATTAPAKQAGVATREEICFEVTSLTELYGAAPYLVTLTPNTSALKAALKGLEAGQTIPGVKHWRESKSIVR